MKEKKAAHPCAPLIGAHMSIAGGIWRAFARAEEVGANCLQVFVKSNVQWRTPTLTEEDVALFKSERKRTGISAVAAHACYLANPASPDRTIFGKSVEDIRQELLRAEALEIPWLVLHPGNHLGSGIDAGKARVAQALGEALAATRKAGVLLETTSGAGTAVGSSFEHLADIIESAGGGPRLAICLDTAHVFGAGYDIKSADGYEAAKRSLRKCGLLALVRVIHANDSKAALGSRADRHAHIGKGRIGLEGFRRVMRDGDFAGVPKILETPKGQCGRRPCDAVNIAALRRLQA